MDLIKELLNLNEDADEFEPTPIPPKVLRYLHDNDINYKVDNLEDLKKAHAEALLRNDPSSEERGLSYALGMNGLSKDELEALVHPPKATTNSTWRFDQGDPAHSGYRTLERTEGDTTYYIVDVDDEGYYQVIWYDQDGEYIDHEVVSKRDEVKHLLDKFKVPHPTEDNFDDIGFDFSHD